MACGADMARGSRADATWHARPRGNAARAHAAPKCVEVALTRGRATRTPGWRHVAVRGLVVKGPRLGNWVGNAIA